MPPLEKDPIDCDEFIQFELKLPDGSDPPSFITMSVTSGLLEVRLTALNIDASPEEIFRRHQLVYKAYSSAAEALLKFELIIL